MPVRRRVNPQAGRRRQQRLLPAAPKAVRRANPQRGRATQARAPARLRAAASAAMRTPQITRRGGRLGGPTRRRANPQRRRRY